MQHLSFPILILVSVQLGLYLHTFNQGLIYPLGIVNIVQQFLNESTFILDVSGPFFMAEVGRECSRCCIFVETTHQCLVVEPQGLIIGIEQGFVNQF